MSLSVESLEARVGSFTVKLATLDIANGEIVCLMGRSGSGKSTLLSAISGFLPSYGVVRVNGIDVSGIVPEKRRMALVFQRAALFSHLTVLGNVEFGLRMQGISPKERSRKALRWLERVSMKELSHRRVAELSEGQAQRVAFARALAVEFPILLLDEPFSALDVSSRRDMRALLKELVRETETSTLLVTHDPLDALGVADVIHVIEAGQGVWSGSPREAESASVSSVKELFEKC